MRVAPEPRSLWLRLATDLGATLIEAEQDPEAEYRPSGRPPLVRDALRAIVAELGRRLPGGLSRPDLARALGRSPKDQPLRRVLDAHLPDPEAAE